MTSSSRFALTAALGAFVAGAARLPRQASAVAALGVTDAAGLVVRARGEAVVRALAQLHAQGRTGPSSVLLGAGRTSMVDAALVNASAAHAFALDDVAWGCHPSSMLMPALLAVGEHLDASGADLLRAWVVGYEVMAELASREPGSLHATGWHPTGLLGPVGVAAAVAHLLGLDAAGAQAAIANGASMTGGLSGNFGTPMKAVHVGQAAANGVRAALLAQAVLGGNPDVLEKPGGFLSTISPSKQVDLESPLGTSHEAPRVLVAGLSLKRYPLCYSLHRIADAAIDVACMEGFSHEAVVSVEVEMGTRQLQMAPHRQPATELQARYSAPFAVASGLVARAAGFAQLDPDFFGSAAVRRLIERTQVTPTEGVNPEDPVFDVADRVRVKLTDGRTLDSGPVTHPLGHARRPLDAAARMAKFQDCLRGSEVRDAKGCYEMLCDLERLPSVRRVAEAFSR